MLPSNPSATPRPASMLPAGPPTRGKPIVFTMASTEAASCARYDDSRVSASSLTDVRTSRTIVCASTPLMKIGTYVTSTRGRLQAVDATLVATGSSPWRSIVSINSGM